MDKQRYPKSKSRLPRLLPLLLVAAAMVTVLHGYRTRSGTPHPPASPGELSITFFNVGPGESTLIQTPLGKNILVDTGPSSARSALFTGLKHCGVHQLDLLLITHPGDDTSGNRHAVLGQFPVASVMTGEIDTVLATHLLRPPTAVQLTSTIPPSGQKFLGQTIDLGGGASLEYMTVTGGRWKSPKDSQLILWVSIGRISTLLLGSASPQARASLLAQIPNVHATILQAAPSTLTDGLDRTFLGRVQPESMVISGRLGPHAPPHSAAEKFALHPLQPRTWRTDEKGSLTLLTNGTAYSFLPTSE